ncbi:MAG: hypothetical protein HFI33_09480 [Lachnospiraceae bacterium]|nr:hypothetical protein [Lachnospiraceae bacterium]
MGGQPQNNGEKATRRRRVVIWLLALIFVVLMPVDDTFQRKLLPENFSGEEGIFLYPGAYILTIEYASKVPVQVRGVDAKYVNSDNTQGKELFNLTLPASEDGREQIYFTGESRTTGLHLYSEEIQSRSFVGYKLHLESAERIYRDKEFLVVLVFLGGLLFLWYCNRRSFTKEEKLSHLLLLGSAVLVSWILTSEYLPEAHDLMIHFNRIEGLADGLKAGYFPVRIYPNLMNDHGYAFPIFYPDLFLYLPAALRVLGVSTFLGYKVLIFLLHLGTAYGGWFAFSRLTGSRRWGLVAALLYTLAPYRLMDTYVRAALGESLAMAFLPLWLYGVYELIRGNYKRWIWAVISFTCLLRSHLLTTELAVLLTVIMALFSIHKILDKKRFLTILLAGGCTLGLNIGFLVPFVDHMGYDYNVFLEAAGSLSKSTLQGPNLFSFYIADSMSSHLYYFDTKQNFSWNLGLGLVAGCLCLVVAGILHEKHKLAGYEKAKKSMVLGILFVYASTKWFPWQMIFQVEWLRNLTSILQFPWRLLAFATLFLSIAAAYGLEQLFQEQQMRKLFLAVGLGFSALCAVVYLDCYYGQAEASIFKSSSPFLEHKQVDELYLIGNVGRGSYYRRENIIEPENENLPISISNYQNGPLYLEFDYATEENQKLNLPFVYDKHYEAFLDTGEQLLTYIGGSGRLGLYVEAGSGHVQVGYKDPGLYRAADGLQILVLVFLLAGFGWARRRVPHIASKP